MYISMTMIFTHVSCQHMSLLSFRVSIMPCFVILQCQSLQLLARKCKHRAAQLRMVSGDDGRQ